MKLLRIETNRPVCRSLWAVLIAIPFLVTGCPHNDYTVELKPHGDGIQRTLIFYCADGTDKKTGDPQYHDFDPAELAAISACYPAGNLTNTSTFHLAWGDFTNTFPGDVGGTGTYAQFTTSLGAAGIYAERFRGNDDLAGVAERRFQAVDQVTDLFLGWSKMQLGHEPGYDQLRQFLDINFRRDLKNAIAYLSEGQFINTYKTNTDQEFLVRIGEYLLERGYFSAGEIPGLFRNFSENDAPALRQRLQRLVARKMGIPDTQPIPASLAFLADENTLNKSLNKYLVTTKLYRAQLKRWQTAKKLKADLKKPEPDDVFGDDFGNLIAFNFFSDSDHLSVKLALPAAPLHTNGKWDETHQQVIWNTDLVERSNVVNAPFFCFANWVQPNKSFQRQHFGKVALTGEPLTQYCLWRNSLAVAQGEQWDTFLSSLNSGPDLIKTIENFRFTSEPPAKENIPASTTSPSDYPRNLLAGALQ